MGFLVWQIESPSINRESIDVPTKHMNMIHDIMNIKIIIKALFVLTVLGVRIHCTT